MTTRDKIVDTLEEIALLLELKGENPFKIRAYRNGAEVVQSYPGDIVQKAADNDLKGIKGIGAALQDKLQELATKGELKFHQDLRAEFPDSIFELFDIQGLGPKKIKGLYDQLGVSTLLVMGGCGDYFEVADTVIGMREFQPYDATDDAHRIARESGQLRTVEAQRIW